MITKKTLSFALVALIATSAFAAKPKAKRIKSKVQPGIVRKTAGFAGRVATSRPIMFVVGCLTYPILQKTLFADSPLLDVKAIASFVSNKWQNNFAKATVNSQTAYNHSATQVQTTFANSIKWLQNSWATTSNFAQGVYNSQSMQKAIDLAAKAQVRANPTIVKTNFTAWTKQTKLDPTIAHQMTNGGASDWEL